MNSVPKFDWTRYYESALADGDPLTLFDKAVSCCESRERSLDLGSGASQASIAMIKAGFRSVTAVDSSPQAEEYSRVPKTMAPSVFSFERAWFHEFKFGTDRFDLVHADMALPYAGIRHFPGVIRSIVGSLRPRGVFAASFFGNRHFLRLQSTAVVFVSPEELASLLSGLALEIEDIVVEHRGYRMHYLVVSSKKI